MKTSLKLISTSLLLLIIILLAGFYGCKGKPEERPDTRKTVIYFSDENLMFLVPLTFSLQEEATPEIAIRKLISEPAPDEHLEKLIPEDIELLDFEIKDDVASLDFSSPFKKALDVGGLEGTMIVNSLKYTLSHFEGIKYIKLLIEGKEVEVAGELDLSGNLEIERWKNLFLSGRESRVPGEENRATMYFILPDTELLVPVTCVFEEKENLPRNAIMHLVRGIGEIWVNPVLPGGTEIVDFRIEKGIAFLDFNSSFLKSDENLAPKIILDSLAFTLTEFEDIDKISINVDGKKLEKYGSVNLSDYISRPQYINILIEEEVTMGGDIPVLLPEMRYEKI